MARAISSFPVPLSPEMRTAVRVSFRREAMRLNFCRGADDAVDGGFGIHALAEKFVLFDQADFFGHAAQELAQFFQWRKWLGDVVIRAQLHGLDRGLDGTVAGHERDFSAGKKFFYFFQKFEARHPRHDHIAEDHVDGLLFEQGQGGFAAIGFETDEAEALADGDAEFADGLLVIDDEEAHAELFPAQIALRISPYCPSDRPAHFSTQAGLSERRFVGGVIQRAFPIVFSTALMRSCTRNGFSRYSAPILRSVETVSSLA